MSGSFRVSSGATALLATSGGSKGCRLALNKRSRIAADIWPVMAGLACDRNCSLTRLAKRSAVLIVIGLSSRPVLRSVKMFLSDVRFRCAAWNRTALPSTKAWIFLMALIALVTLLSARLAPEALVMSSEARPPVPNLRLWRLAT